MIVFEDVTKTYGSTTAVDHLSFTAPAGRITGFLGPNGAGKSTALKVLMGLTRPTGGRAMIAGRSCRAWSNPGHLVGALLDADAFHPGRSGRESLALSCQVLGLARTRVDEVLEEVGLTPQESRRRVRAYSLGMRQRLGLAQALLTDPPVLVCDEPANGLDPQGQRWLAELLADRARRGCTVLLSSHRLAEIERIADRVVILANGRLVVEDTVAGLREAHADLSEYYFTATSHADRAA
ncbi:MAG TPA: ATP-binding cassette domain-containing protein [Candidatus Avipropionibacterium avicola]|uniref:ATP-binding cassette domain-containing protein n=1 Tax=Candidatus Avipropionibacterium avicola TaxID=2840701 RepID=A0A9D1KMU1_9ACTN|nr:ATP-binding cassette domain-containing protein [Candidatus Avipropionibacterium avicola]